MLIFLWLRVRDIIFILNMAAQINMLILRDNVLIEIVFFICPQDLQSWGNEHPRRTDVSWKHISFASMYALCDFILILKILWLCRPQYDAGSVERSGHGGMGVWLNGEKSHATVLHETRRTLLLQHSFPRAGGHHAESKAHYKNQWSKYH